MGFKKSIYKYSYYISDNDNTSQQMKLVWIMVAVLGTIRALSPPRPVEPDIDIEVLPQPIVFEPGRYHFQ